MLLILYESGFIWICFRLFFDHLGTILLMAVVGTIFNVITIGEEIIKHRVNRINNPNDCRIGSVGLWPGWHLW